MERQLTAQTVWNLLGPTIFQSKRGRMAITDEEIIFNTSEKETSFFLTQPEIKSQRHWWLGVIYLNLTNGGVTRLMVINPALNALLIAPFLMTLVAFYYNLYLALFLLVITLLSQLIWIIPVRKTWCKINDFLALSNN